MPKPIGQPPLQMPKHQQPFNPHQQPNYPPRLYPSNLDPSLSSQINSQLSNQISNQLSSQLNQQPQAKGGHPNQFQILDTQPRQPFSYNLNQPVPAFLNQRVHPAELSSLESVQLIQPKPVPTIPSLPNMLNPNLINLTRYPARNLAELQPPQNPPLPAKNQWSNSDSDCPPKAPPRRKVNSIVPITCSYPFDHFDHLKPIAIE